MAESADLGPLTLTHADGVYRFTLTDAFEPTLEIAPYIENTLRDALRDVLAAESPAPIEFDLEDVPGLSSRQLGLMLALHNVVRDRYDTVPLTHVSPPVQKLLEVTRINRFFSY